MGTGNKVREGKAIRTEQTGVAMGNLMRMVHKVSGVHIDMEMLVEMKVLVDQDKIGDLSMMNFLATHHLVCITDSVWSTNDHEFYCYQIN